TLGDERYGAVGGAGRIVEWRAAGKVRMRAVAERGTGAALAGAQQPLLILGHDELLRLESGPLVRPVAEWLRRRTAAAAPEICAAGLESDQAGLRLRHDRFGHAPTTWPAGIEGG